VAVLVDVHGSCVSRSCFEFIDKSQILVQHTFSRNHIVSCMMPPANLSFQHGELQLYNSEYSERCMRLALDKQTVPLLLKSDAEYLIIDFFDFCQPVAAYLDTTFSTYDYTFYRTSAYQEHKELFNTVDFLNVPVCLWYGYVDAYFRAMDEKFHGHIVLNRLNCCGIYLSKSGAVEEIPQNFRFFGDVKYNQLLWALENYVIDKYHPIVIDISKYFISDENYNPDTTPVHFEKNYNILQSNILLQILTDGKRGYFDVLPASIIADLLRRPISDEDFCTICSQRTPFFNSDTVLDYIFQIQDVKEITANREWIASIYQKYDEACSHNHSGINGVEAILSDSSLWKEDEGEEKNPSGKMSFNICAK